MKVKDLIEQLKYYNQDADVFLNSNYKHIGFTLAFGGDDGVEKENCETVSIYPDDLGCESSPTKRMYSEDEPKQENCCTPEGQIKRYVDCKGCDRKPKQETLEEAKLRQLFKNRSNCFIETIKEWQQEKMYSEEEVIEFTMKMISQYVFGNTNIWDRDRLKESLLVKKL